MAIRTYNEAGKGEDALYKELEILHPSDHSLASFRVGGASILEVIV